MTVPYLVITVFIFLVLIIVFQNNNESEMFDIAIREIMKQYKVIIGGCCRNIESHVKKSLSIIDKIGSKFKDYAVIIYENDSVDSTRDILLKNKKSNYYYILENNVKLDSRTARLANGRNHIIDKIFERQKVEERAYKNPYDFFIMIDMDDVIGSEKIVTTIDTCFKYKDWDMLAANQSNLYYDIWAYRKKGHKETDCWLDVEKDINNGVDYGKALFDNVTHFSAAKPVGGLIEVISAFGGVAIYKISSIEGCRYSGILNYREICEHVPMHECMVNNGKKIYINTEMLTD